MPSIVCEIQLEYARMSMKTLTVKCGLKLKRNGIRLYNLISKVFTNRLDGAHRDPMIGYRPYGEFVSPGSDQLFNVDSNMFGRKTWIL